MQVRGRTIRLLNPPSNGVGNQLLDSRPQLNQASLPPVRPSNPVSGVTNQLRASHPRRNGDRPRHRREVHLNNGASSRHRSSNGDSSQEGPVAAWNPTSARCCPT